MATATDLNEITNLIQAVNRSIAGLRPGSFVNAPPITRYPLKADYPTDAPLCLTWCMGGPWTRQQFGSKPRVDDTFQVFVFVCPLGENTFPARIVDAQTMLSRFRRMWLSLSPDGGPTALADPVSAGDLQVTFELGDTPPSDAGIDTNLTIGGVAWFGFTISLRVRSLGW